MVLISFLELIFADLCLDCTEFDVFVRHSGFWGFNFHEMCVYGEIEVVMLTWQLLWSVFEILDLDILILYWRANVQLLTVMTVLFNRYDNGLVTHDP